MNYVALGWQIVALVACGFSVFVALRFIEGRKVAAAVRAELMTFAAGAGTSVREVRDDLTALRRETMGWLDSQRTAHAHILEDHLKRIATLESNAVESQEATLLAVAKLDARVQALDAALAARVKPQPEPKLIGPYLSPRKA